MNVIGYARLSSSSEASTSIARQHEIIEQYAAKHHLPLVGILTDEGVSATRHRLNRPGLAEVRRRIKSGEADAVLVWRLDRIARSVVDFGTLLDEGVPIVSCTEPLDTTSSMGRAMAEILQVFAAMEARAISARLSMSADYLRRNDRFPGGIVPYGYRSAPHPSGTGRALEVDPVEGPVIRSAAERVLGGESLYKVADDLTRSGVVTRHKAPGWSVQALQGVLTGNAVLGRVTSRGELVRDDHGVPREAWPPILTLDESERLRARCAVKRPAGVRRKASRLLSGLVFCASCGGSMVVQRRRTPRTRDGKTFFEKTAYRCRAQGSGVLCKAPVSIDADNCDDYVVGAFLGAVGRFPVTRERVSTPEPVALSEVEEALSDTARAMTAPGADVSDLVERLHALRARREELLARPAEAVVTLEETGLTFAEEWDAVETTEGRRELLLGAMDHVEISPSVTGKRWDDARVSIFWRS